MNIYIYIVHNGVSILFINSTDLTFLLTIKYLESILTPSSSISHFQNLILVKWAYLRNIYKYYPEGGLQRRRASTMAFNPFHFNFSRK